MGPHTADGWDGEGVTPWAQRKILWVRFLLWWGGYVLTHNYSRPRDHLGQGAKQWQVLPWIKLGCPRKYWGDSHKNAFKMRNPQRYGTCGHYLLCGETQVGAISSFQHFRPISLTYFIPYWSWKQEIFSLCTSSPLPLSCLQRSTQRGHFANSKSSYEGEAGAPSQPGSPYPTPCRARGSKLGWEVIASKPCFLVRRPLPWEQRNRARIHNLLPSISSLWGSVHEADGPHPTACRTPFPKSKRTS